MDMKERNWVGAMHTWIEVLGIASGSLYSSVLMSNIWSFWLSFRLQIIVPSDYVFLLKRMILARGYFYLINA